MAKKIIRHQWDRERIYRGRTIIWMKCRACGVEGCKSRMEGVRPCLGNPHTPECAHMSGHMRHGLTNCKCPGPGAVNRTDIDAAKEAMVKKPKITHYISSETLTRRQWLALGWLLHQTTDKLEWAFVCPRCDRVWTLRQFQDTGQDPDRGYQQCIDRKKTLERDTPGIPKGHCDWCAFGLFGGPWIVTCSPEKEGEKEPRVFVFPFARATKELVEQARREVETLYFEAKVFQTAQDIAHKAGV